MSAHRILEVLGFHRLVPTSEPDLKFCPWCKSYFLRRARPSRKEG